MPDDADMQATVGNIPFKRFALTSKGADDAWAWIRTNADMEALTRVKRALRDPTGIRMLAERLFRMTALQQEKLREASDDDLRQIVRRVTDRLDDPDVRSKRVNYWEEVTTNSPANITCRFGFW